MGGEGERRKKSCRKNTTKREREAFLNKLPDLDFAGGEIQLYIFIEVVKKVVDGNSAIEKEANIIWSMIFFITIKQTNNKPPSFSFLGSLKSTTFY